tara:strand:+ start:168 stop:356 length:189 start_codon:yes stop_codon:yes gene_type:complete
MRYEDLDHRESNEKITVKIILEQYGVSNNDELVNYVHAILQDNNRMRKRMIQINNLAKGYKA